MRRAAARRGKGTRMEHLLHIPYGLSDPTTWVLVALLAFLGVLAYLGVPALLTKALDDRAAAVATELEEARRLREEAQEVLAGYQRRQRAAEQEAQAILERARREADAVAKAMREELTERLQRRAQMAERKIAQAEAEAESLVRQQATRLAAGAAAAVFKDGLDPQARDRLIADSIKDVAAKFGPAL